MHEQFLFVPMILFLVIVAPIWLVLHYRYKTKMASSLSDSEHGSIDSMLDSLDKLADRVETLEAILDSENVSWRKKSRREEGHE